MQNPNEDTQWNDVLRQKGIIPEKEAEITEEDVVNMLEATVEKQLKGKTFDDMDLDELNENEDLVDDEDDRAFEEYRRQRIQEIKIKQSKKVFGDVTEISKQDYVSQVNKAGEGIWSLFMGYRLLVTSDPPVHSHPFSLPMCKMINVYISELAQLHPNAKFLRSRASVCIPDYPDRNVPTLFVYCDGKLIHQYIGVEECGGSNLKRDELEWMLSEVGALVTELEENPRQKVHDLMSSNIKGHESDSDDGYS